MTNLSLFMIGILAILFIIFINKMSELDKKIKKEYRKNKYKNHFSNKKYNSSYFNNRKHNINQGLEKDIREVNRYIKKDDLYYEYTRKLKEEREKERKEKYKQQIQDNIKKGKEYEEFVAGYFKIDGYEIELHGIKNGVKDKGIDIICKKDNELILIQCKNWRADTKYKINHEKLKAFVGSCTEYINQNRLFDKNIKLKFVTSNYILDKSAEMFLKESKTLQYHIIEY